MYRASPLSQTHETARDQIPPRLTHAPADHQRFGASFPIDLIRFSIRAEQRKQHRPSPAHTTATMLGHAAPLISINHRDVTTLDELFWRDDITEIADDLDQALQQILPTPCWEDDPFEMARLGL